MLVCSLDGCEALSVFICMFLAKSFGPSIVNESTVVLVLYSQTSLNKVYALNTGELPYIAL